MAGRTLPLNEIGQPEEMEKKMKSIVISFILIVAAVLAVSQAVNAAAPIEAEQPPPVSAKVIQQAVASAVYELAYSARHNAVFVMAPVFDDDLKAGKKPQVIRLNGDTLKLENATDLPSAGFGTVLDDDNNTLYIGTHESTVLAWDTVSHKVKGEIALADKETDKKTGKTLPAYFLRQLWLDAKNQRLYIPGISFKGGVLYVIDTATFTRIKTIENVGMMPTGITQAADGGDIYLTNWQHEMVVIDSHSLGVKNRFSITADQPLFLAYNPERKEVLAVDEGMEKIYDMLKENAQAAGKTYQASSAGNTLVVLDPRSGKTRQTIATGKYPVAVKVDEKTGRIYVTGRGDGTLSVYSTRDYSLLTTLTVKSAPNSIAVNPKDGSVYISIKRGEEDKQTDKETVARITL